MIVTELTTSFHGFLCPFVQSIRGVCSSGLMGQTCLRHGALRPTRLCPLLSTSLSPIHLTIQEYSSTSPCAHLLLPTTQVSSIPQLSYKLAPSSRIQPSLRKTNQHSTSTSHPTHDFTPLSRTDSAGPTWSRRYHSSRFDPKPSPEERLRHTPRGDTFD